MNTKDNREDTINQTQIEDLTVNEDHAAHVKGGRCGPNCPNHDIIVFDIID